MPRPDGKPTIYEALGYSSPEEMDAALDAAEEEERVSRPWGLEEQCPGCPGHKDGLDGHPDGAHKMSCSATNTRLTIPVSWLIK